MSDHSLQHVERSLVETHRHPRWLQPAYAAAAVTSALVTYGWHRRWESSDDGSPRKGLLDGLCHLGTALAVTLPVLPYVQDRKGFLRIALISAVIIDLDHIPAARSIRLDRCMTMPHRPPSHSLLAPMLVAAAIERARPKRHLGLGVLLGLVSHLLRDLGTGGAPLVHPRRVITMPYGLVVVLLSALTWSSRQATRRALGTQLMLWRATTRVNR